MSLDKIAENPYGRLFAEATLMEMQSLVKVKSLTLSEIASEIRKKQPKEIVTHAVVLQVEKSDEVIALLINNLMSSMVKGFNTLGCLKFTLLAPLKRRCKQGLLPGL